MKVLCWACGTALRESKWRSSWIKGDPSLRDCPTCKSHDNIITLSTPSAKLDEEVVNHIQKEIKFRRDVDVI